ncbi:MAG: AMIN domain-containing protein, partial [Pseudomonadota bacterium]|nr:AMIN domain-containing protein [Pseudomonadota bacterium]
MRTFSNIKKLLTVLLAVALMLNASYAVAKAELANVRVGQKIDKTRIVFDIKQNHRFKVYKLNNPSRVVVDFYKTENELNFKNKHYTDSRLYRVRVKDSKNQLRVILDLHKNFDYNYFTLAKNKAGAERLVVDLTHLVGHKPIAKTSKKVVETKSRPAVTQPRKIKQNVAKEVRANPVTQSLLSKDSSVLVKSDLFVVA